jgi:hypothetical protein
LGASPNSIPIALVAGASQVIRGARTRYKGIVVRETAGTGAVLRIWDNASAASGTLIDVIVIGANAVVSIYLPDDGIVAEKGIYIERVSGTTYEGSIRLG